MTLENFVIHLNVIDNIMHMQHSVAIDKWMQTMMLATVHTKPLKKQFIFIAFLVKIASNTKIDQNGPEHDLVNMLLTRLITN